MFFGAIPPLDAEDGVLAHRVQAGAVTFRKGHRLTSTDCAMLAAEGVSRITIARFGVDDVGEDEAAARIATSASGAGVRIAPAFTGRANLFAAIDGVLMLEPAAIHAFNVIDEGLTIATLPAFRRVVEGEMIGTVKIIPFAISGAVLANGLTTLGADPAIRVAPFRALRVGMIQLTLPSLKAATLDKTREVTLRRITALSGSMAFEQRLAHDEGALVAALHRLDHQSFDLLLIFGAAAITDRRDVIPAAIEAAGGHIEHLGMPVDPGNLLLLAELAGKPVIGAPGCARAPAENGFDWVLERLHAGIPVRRADIQAMGVGGLLMEIISRPQPREGGEAT